MKTIKIATSLRTKNLTVTDILNNYWIPFENKNSNVYYCIINESYYFLCMSNFVDLSWESSSDFKNTFFSLNEDQFQYLKLKLLL